MAPNKVARTIRSDDNIFKLLTYIINLEEYIYMLALNYKILSDLHFKYINS